MKKEETKRNETTNDYVDIVKCIWLKLRLFVCLCDFEKLISSLHLDF